MDNDVCTCKRCPCCGKRIEAKPTVAPSVPPITPPGRYPPYSPWPSVIAVSDQTHTPGDVGTVSWNVS